MSPLLRGVIVVSLLALTAALASAEPQNGGAAISLGVGGVRVPLVAIVEPDSGALVVLEDLRNASRDIWVQRTDRHGRPTLGPEGTLVWTSPVGANLNGISPDGSGGVVFAWDAPGGTNGRDVLVQRIQSNGTLAYPLPGIVVCNATGDQINPFVAPSSGGSYWVFWPDQRAGVPGQADLYVQRMNLAGAPQLAANGIAANTAAFRMQYNSFPDYAPEIAGGILLAWGPTSGGVRAQRINPAGTLQYGATGAAIGMSTDFVNSICTDGNGGLWTSTVRFDGTNYTPYAHHLTSAGASTFSTTGIAFFPANSASFAIQPVRDASNGCFFYFQAFSSPPSMTGDAVYRNEVDISGNVLLGAGGENFGYPAESLNLFDTGTDVVTVVQEFPNLLGWQLRVQRWAYDGTPAYPGAGVVVGRAAPNYGLTQLTAAGSSSHLVFEGHADPRYNTPANFYNYQAFGQMFDTAGNPLWDDAENPNIVSAKDAPNDQGGFVRVTWNASAADDPSAKMAVGYRGWRSLELTAAASLRARHAGVDGMFTDHGKQYLALTGQYWEQVAQEPAVQLPSYALSLPTSQDSVAGNTANQSFMVEAYDDSSHHWFSNPLTAHSVDNIPPAVPAPFTGNYVSGTTYMLWNANTEPDLASYRLYRGGTVGFVPGPGNLIATLTSPGYSDVAGFPAIYKLSAVDTHGNQSGFAVLVPSGITGVGGNTPRELAFTLGSGNPSRNGAALVLAMPTAGKAHVAIYDASGREVRSLTDGEQAVGVRTLTWDGVDASGHAASSGLYFARLVTAQRAMTLRFAMVR